MVFESLDEEKRATIKAEIANRLFNAPDDMGISKADEEYDKRLEKLNKNMFAELLAFINKISK